MNQRELMNVYRELKSRGLVGYGKIIPVEHLEDLLGVKYSEDWSWLGPTLELRKYLTELGYFVSERGTDDGDLRFLSEVEIPEHLHKRRLKRYVKMNSDLKAAMRLPTTALGDKHVSVLRHEQDRLSRDISKIADEDPEIREIFCET